MRPRKLRSIVLAGMALLFCHLTLAQVQPNQRARKIERFEPREGTLRIAAIHAAWERTMSKLKAADPSKPCSEFPRERCVDGHFKPPFPAALKATDFPRGSNWKNPDRIRYLLEENRYSWAPIEMVAGGKELLQSYRRQAASGNLFGC